MSEDRLAGIEALLISIRAEMATKTDLVAFRAETKADLVALRAETKADLVALRDQMATKADLTALRAETKADLTALRAETKADLAALRDQMATKADLEAAMADVAKNVDVTLIGRQLRELASMKDDITVVSALAQRLDNTMVRLIGDVLTEVRAEHSRMDRLLNRVKALEEVLPEH
jgi:ribosomal protein L29